MHDVITIGSATLDVFLKCNNLETLEHNGEEKIAFPFGSKINVDGALFETGGGATNTATTFARQRLNVAVIGKIGKDFAGSRVVAKLKEEEINTQHLVQDENDSTDFSTIIWAASKGSVILVNRGKEKLEVSEVDWDSLSTKWFYISSVEGNLDILRHVENTFKEKKTKIVWNPGKREIEHKDIVFELSPQVELLIINKREASLLLDISSDSIQDLLSAASKLQSRKKLITDGHNGSYYWNGESWKHAGVFKVDRKEATGAGDAFGSAFVAGLIKEMSEDDCLNLASANAASVVTAPSAKQGILTEEKSREWMEKELKIETI